MIKYLLFDFDDTLGNRDVYTYHNYSDYIEMLATDRSELEKEAMKQDCMLYDMRGNISKAFVLEKVAAKYQLAADTAAFLRYWEENAGVYAETFSEVREILSELQKDYHLVCVTNGPQKTQMAKLTTSGIADLFYLIVTSGEIGAHKPDKKIFEYVLQKINAKVEECVFIGDTFSTDILGALRIGMSAIWICDKKRPCAYPIQRIEHIRELKKILNNMNATEKVPS